MMIFIQEICPLSLTHTRSCVYLCVYARAHLSYPSDSVGIYLAILSVACSQPRDEARCGDLVLPASEEDRQPPLRVGWEKTGNCWISGPSVSQRGLPFHAGQGMDAVIHHGHVQTRHRIRGGEIKGGTASEDSERGRVRWSDFWGGICRWGVCVGLPSIPRPAVEGEEMAVAHRDFTYSTEQATFSPWGIARGRMIWYECINVCTVHVGVTGKITIDGSDRTALDTYGGRKRESKVRRKRKY